MKTLMAAVLVLVAGSATGWSQVTDPSEQERIIQSARTAQRAREHRQQMAAKGDAYQVRVYTFGERLVDVITVGELRQAGYEVLVDNDDNYDFVKGIFTTGVPSSQVEIIRQIKMAQQVQAHRRQMASEGDAYRLTVGYPISAITVGELRQAGYKVLIDNDDNYDFVKGIFTTGVPSSQVEIIRQIKMAQRVQTHRQQMLAQGDAYQVYLGRMTSNPEATVTVGELRQAGYEVRVDNDDNYLFTKENSVTSVFSELTRIIREVRIAQRAQAHRADMASQGDAYQVRIGYLESDPSATVGELRQAGYEVRVDDNDNYVFVRLGGQSTSSSATNAEVLDKVSAQKEEKLKAKMGKVENTIKETVSNWAQ